MAVRDLIVRLIADDQTSRGFGGFAGGLSRTNVALGAAAAAAGAFGVSAVRAGSDFDATVRQMGSVAGIPADGMKELSKLALQMGKDTSFSAQEAADAMLELAKGGLTAAEIKSGALKETLTLAAAGGVSLAEAGTTMANSMGMFGLKAEEASRVSAALAGGATASTASVESLSQSLAQVGPGARNAGLSIEETVGALSAFAKAGFQGSDAGTSLKTFLTTLVPKTKQAYDAFARLGLAQFDAAKAAEYLRSNGIEPLGTSQEVLEKQLRNLVGEQKGVKAESAAATAALDGLAQAGVTTSNAFYDANGNTKSMTEIAGILQSKLAGLTEEEKNRTLATLFGSDATRAATVLMNEGSEGLAKFIKATSDSGAANRIAAENMKGTKGALEQLSGSFDTLKTQAGLALGPFVESAALFGVTILNGIVPALDKMKDAFGTVARFIGDNWTVIKTAAIAAAAVLSPLFVVLGAQFAIVGAAAVASAARQVVAWVTASAGATVNAATQLAACYRVVGGWVLMGAQAVLHAARVVAGWVMTSAGAIAAGAVMAAQAARFVAGWVLMGTQSLLQAARVAAAWLIAMGPIGLVIAAVVGLVAVVVANWDTIRTKTAALWNAVKEFTASAWASIRSTVSGAFQAVVGAVSSGVGSVLATVSGLPGKILGAIGNLGSLLANAGRELIQGLIGGIAAKLGALRDKMKAVADTIKGFLPGSPVKEGPLRSWNNGAAGQRLMGLLASGIDGDPVRAALTRALDLGDVVGMRTGGSGFVQDRLASSAGTAPAEPGGASMDDLVALLREQNELLRRMPSDYRLADRTR